MLIPKLNKLNTNLSKNHHEKLISSPLQLLEIQVANAKTNSATPESNRLISSPIINQELNQNLHLKLQEKTSIDKKMDDYNERNSIYSFDSVSTNGRLLDRLGLDNDTSDDQVNDHANNHSNNEIPYNNVFNNDSNDPIPLDDDNDEFDPLRRDSMISIQSTGRLLDRLGLDDDEFVKRNSTIQKPHQPRPTNPRQPNLPQHQQRQPTNHLTGNLQHQRHPPNHLPRNPQQAQQFLNSVINKPKPNNQNQQQQALQRKKSVNVKNVNVVYSKRSNSISSFSADFQLSRNSSMKSEYTVDQPIEDDSDNETINSVDTYTGNSSASIGIIENDLYNDDTSISDDEVFKHPGPIDQTLRNSNESLTDSLDLKSAANVESFNPPNALPHNLLGRSPSAPIVSQNSSNDSFPKPPSLSPQQRRVTSDNINTSPSSISSSPNPSPAPPNSELSVESRTKMAIQLRSMGNHREASYQLQIAANRPNNYPKAMYLYALALRFGQGVKKNDRHCLKWLVKSILISIMYDTLRSSDAPNISITLNNYVTKLNDLQPEEMISMIYKSLLKEKDYDDPIKIYNHFNQMGESNLSKLINNLNKQNNVMYCAYHELGNSIINGWGLKKSDEVIGITLLSKAGSLGNVNSMIQLGEMWCNKSKYHKKDHYLAAAWLRLSELFGAKSIGNSWIYKEKYMEVKKKK